MAQFRYRAASRRDTAVLAESLARHVRPGDTILLSGMIGVGKTALVQDIAEALGVEKRPTSPTFILANFIPGKELNILHVDTYRLNVVEEFHDLGLEDFMDECVTLVEWGELLVGEFPDHLRIFIEFLQDEEEGREFTIFSHAERWHHVIESLRRGHLRVVT